MRKHGSQVYLINTGWSGGPFGIGARMDIDITRAIVYAAISGDLDNVEYNQDSLFHTLVPRSCPGVPGDILNPCNTWQDKGAFSIRAQKLAGDFRSHFEKAYGDKGIDPAVRSQCPGM
jgi:phosphoenolpyruvate carboxykinase (ATP)